MAKVESKTNMSIDIEVKAGHEKFAHLRLTKGNINYYRANAQNVTARYTYLQLVDLIEQNLEKQDG